MADTLYIDALPAGIRSSFIDNGNGLSMHVLEAGRAGQPPYCCCTVFQSWPIAGAR